MNRYPNSSKAERFGRWLGKNCRIAVNQERRLWNWLRAKHVPTMIVFLLSWSVRVALIIALFTLSFWLLLFVLAIVLVSKISVPEGEYGQHDVDHRKTLYYDPKNYNDDPDPRFDDE